MARKPQAARMPPWDEIPAGAKVVVDTAPIIYLLEDHPTFAPRYEGLFQAEAAGRIQIAISAITIAEVLTGPMRHGEDAIARRYEKALNGYEVIATTAEIAATAARLRVRYALKLPDAIQLASALEISASAFVTHDRDFARVQGIKIL